MLLVNPLTTLLLLLSPALSFAATKTITLDTANPTTIVQELLDHPYITYTLASAISAECQHIARIENFLETLNATDLPTFVGPNGAIINVTAVVLAAEADLSALSSNKTLINICHKANQIVKDCGPLVDNHNSHPRSSAIASYLSALQTHSAVTVARPSRTLVITLDPTATALAKGNRTLLQLCEAWALGLRQNLTTVDAALYAADVVSGASTSSSSATGSAATSTPSTTSKSGAVVNALASSGLLGTLGVLFLGMVLLL